MEDHKEEYKEKIIEMIKSITDEWILKQICTYTECMIKED